jgi:hypothetical protein
MCTPFFLSLHAPPLPVPSLQVMLARHSCTAAEVQDVLFVLERKDAIMVDGDDIFLCN